MLNKEIVVVRIAGKALVLQRQCRRICVFTRPPTKQSNFHSATLRIGQFSLGHPKNKPVCHSIQIHPIENGRWCLVPYCMPSTFPQCGVQCASEKKIPVHFCVQRSQHSALSQASQHRFFISLVQD